MRSSTETDRHVLSDRAINWLVLIILAAFVLALRLMTVFKAEINMDDSVFMIYGRTLLRGGIPYVDFWDHHPLGGMLLFGLVGRIFGHTFVTMRWFTIFLVALECFLLYRVGSVLGRRARVAGIVAAVIFAVYSLNNLGQAADRIFFHAPLMTLATYWVVTASSWLNESRSYRPLSVPRLLTIGLLMGFERADQVYLLPRLCSAGVRGRPRCAGWRIVTTCAEP